MFVTHLVEHCCFLLFFSFYLSFSPPSSVNLLFSLALRLTPDRWNVQPFRAKAGALSYNSALHGVFTVWFCPHSVCLHCSRALSYGVLAVVHCAVYLQYGVFTVLLAVTDTTLTGSSVHGRVDRILHDAPHWILHDTDRVFSTWPRGPDLTRHVPDFMWRVPGGSYMTWTGFCMTPAGSYVPWVPVDLTMAWTGSYMAGVDRILHDVNCRCAGFLAGRRRSRSHHWVRFCFRETSTELERLWG